jgi:hypothetical protein
VLDEKTNMTGVMDEDMSTGTANACKSFAQAPDKVSVVYTSTASIDRGKLESIFCRVYMLVKRLNSFRRMHWLATTERFGARSCFRV